MNAWTIAPAVMRGLEATLSDGLYADLAKHRLCADVECCERGEVHAFYYLEETPDDTTRDYVHFDFVLVDSRGVRV